MFKITLKTILRPLPRILIDEMAEYRPYPVGRYCPGPHFFMGCSMELCVYQKEIETIVCEHLEKQGYKIPREPTGEYKCLLQNGWPNEEDIELSIFIDPWASTEG